MTALEINNCIHCGTESQPTWRFCRRCGTALENLDQQPTVAHCSNCASPVADGWRFCANCGTGTDTAAVDGGLSEDAVADLMATAATAPAAPAADSAVAEAPVAEAAAPEAPAAESAPEPTPAAAPEPETTALEPVAEEVPDVAAPEVEVQPTISEPEVSFEPIADVAPTSDGAPPAFVEDGPAAPPPPPPDPLLGDADIAVARAEAEPPPAPPVDMPVAEAPQAAEDPFATSEPATELEQEEDQEIVAGVSADSRIEDEPVEVEEPTRPAVHIPTAEDDEPPVQIPTADDRPEIRSAIPTPLGEAAPAAAASIEIDREPSRAAKQKRRVAVPEPIDSAEDEDEEGLPPLDGRFKNPGLIGQIVQVLLVITAGLGAAMMLALIVLNNRLDSYATSGEGLARVTSAESMVNTWMRPLLVASVIITYALLVMWSRRVLDNLDAFNNTIDETPLWMWMMPVANMWVLFRHLDMAWKGSDYYARGARTWQRGVPDVWAAVFVLLPTIGFILVLYAWVRGADSFEAAIDSNAYSMIGYAAIALGLLAGVRAISNIIERQRVRVGGIR